MAIATDKTDLPMMTTPRIINMVIKDMLQKFYGKTKELDEKIQEAYKSVNHGVFFPRGKVQATLLMGFPGQGKTTAFKVAATTVGEMLGMTVKINPTENEVITQNDLLLLSQEMSGEVHNTGTTGLPQIKKEAINDCEVAFTSYAPDRRIAMINHAGAAVILYDDIANAAPNIQNIILSLVEEGRYRGLDIGKHTYVGLTGNLGAIDGTHVSKLSSAMRTRAKVFEVSDDLDDFIQRTQMAAKSEAGDGGVSSFLKNKPEYFHSPNARGYSSYATSRTWSAFAANMEELAATMHELRKIRFQEGKDLLPAEIDSFINEAGDIARGTVGTEIGTHFRAFFHALQTSAMPIAMEIVESNGNVNKKLADKIKKKCGECLSRDELDFASQLSLAVSDLCAGKVVAAAKQSNCVIESMKPAYDAAARCILDALPVTPIIHARAIGNFVLRLAAMDERLAYPTTVRGASLIAMSIDHAIAFANSTLLCNKTKEKLGNGTYYDQVIVPELSNKGSVTSDESFFSQLKSNNNNDVDKK